MKILFEQANSSFEGVISHLKQELSALRAGRANPQMVESIQANAYGQMMNLQQLANINVVDPTLITVAPWDKSLIPEIVKAIQTSDLGINPIIDGDQIKIPIPPLTEERRLEYVKMLKQKLEDARIQVRQIRKEIMLSLEEEKSEGHVSEDEIKRKEKELQDKVEKFNKTIEDIGEEKEKELMTV